MRRTSRWDFDDDGGVVKEGKEGGCVLKFEGGRESVKRFSVSYGKERKIERKQANQKQGLVSFSLVALFLFFLISVVHVYMHLLSRFPSSQMPRGDTQKEE